MVLVRKSAAAAEMNTAMPHSEGLQKLMGTDMCSGAAAHKATSMYSEALPLVATIENMGSLGAAAGGMAAAARSGSEVAQCLHLAEGHLHSTGWKSPVGMVLTCFGLVEAHRHSSDLNAAAVVLRPWQS
jgi:hypothetical protein